MADQVRDRRPAGGDDDARLPAEEHGRRDREDEAERDAAGVHALDGHGKTLGKNHAEEEPRDRQAVGGRVRHLRVGHARRHNRRDPRQSDGGHERENSRRYGGGLLSPPRHGRWRPRVRGGSTPRRDAVHCRLTHHHLPFHPSGAE